ncbi:MAG: SGNH/GDSL hydrolase family protein [Oscillospiraceae bacterium]|nr:SGNH/GDSL hydrolase family protein [Oscillospiraceae bacterium]
MKVTVYGDSILKGVLLEGERYVVERAWQAKLAERFSLRVENRSRFGCTILKALARIRKDTETPCAEPEYALLEFGGNDCDFDWSAVSVAPDEAHSCKTPPAQFLDCYRRAIRLLRDAGRTPVLTTLPPINAELYLRFLCRAGLSRANIVRWLGDVERIYRWQENYSHMAEQLSREESTALIDLRRPFLQDARSPSALLCADGIHPSRLGQDLIYGAFCAAMD